MTTIGAFVQDGEAFVGSLSTLSQEARLRLVPAEKSSERQPDYRLLKMLGEGAGYLDCGAGWTVENDTSGTLVNVKIDDPAWAAPIHARLMRGVGDVLPLVWIRRAEPASPSASGPPTSSPPASG